MADMTSMHKYKNLIISNSSPANHEGHVDAFIAMELLLAG